MTTQIRLNKRCYENDIPKEPLLRTYYRYIKCPMIIDVPCALMETLEQWQSDRRDRIVANVVYELVAHMLEYHQVYDTRRTLWHSFGITGESTIGKSLP